MEKILSLKQALFRLCNGEYSIDDIHQVVEVFFTRTRRFLLHRETQHWHFRDEWEERDSEIDDLAMDFIAPLFARDENGVFIELQRYFQTRGNLSDSELMEQIDRLLNSVIRQQSIHLFRQRDRFGRIFHRSLRYVLSKHPEWERTILYGDMIVRNFHNGNTPAPKHLLEELFRETTQSNFSLTTQIEFTIEQLIREFHYVVVVSDILSLARQLHQTNLEQASNKFEQPGDPFLAEYIQLEITSTIQQIDHTILEKYEKSGKLEIREREGFREALKHMLLDFSDGGLEENYYTYLSEHLSSLDNMDIYRKKYRAQFEYLVKKSKEIFSARMKNDLSI